MGHWSPETTISPLLRFSLTLSSLIWDCCIFLMTTYLRFDQFKLAGHSKDPVHSWLKPQSLFMSWAKGGLGDSPLGVIQSSMMPFKLFISSAQALEAPFWIQKNDQWLSIDQICTLSHQFSNLEYILIRPIHQVLFKARDHLHGAKIHCMLMALPISINQVFQLNNVALVSISHSSVNDSLDASASSVVLRNPLWSNELTVHKACTVWSKCLLWCISGSVLHLSLIISVFQAYSAY